MMTRTYTALAPFYDRLMAHVEYDRWAAYVKGILSAYVEAKAPLLLEIGGGTGLLGKKLATGGIRYTGSDFSPSMCREARQKGMRFFAADARALPLKKSRCFDMVIFLYDGINYLHTMAEYRAAFGEVHSCLRPGGIFLFDITTLTNSVRNFSAFFDADDYGDHFYIRRSHFHAGESLQFNDFTVFRRVDGPYPGENGDHFYRKCIERHVQKVYPVKTIRDAVPRGLFDIIGIWDDFTRRRYSSRSERVHFLLRKIAS
jgi:SAM-dependent methyltransferase